MPHQVLRECSVCSDPIPDRPFQSPTVRACSPHCAKTLAHQEHPELDPIKDRLAEIGRSALEN